MNTPALHALKTGAVLAAAAGLAILGAGAASAHVNVDPASTSEGGYSQLTFRVPNESETAKTSKLTVTLPKDTPFTSVSVKPMDGWKAEIKEAALPKPVTANGATITKAAATVTWTADAAHQISQHEYQTFSISVGRLPKAGTTVVLPAAQAYTDGTVVNWNQTEVAGQAEPDHPAPSFVTTAPAGEHGAGGHTAAEATPAADTTPASATSPAGDSAPAALGWAGEGKLEGGNRSVGESRGGLIPCTGRQGDLQDDVLGLLNNQSRTSRSTEPLTRREFNPS